MFGNTRTGELTVKPARSAIMATGRCAIGRYMFYGEAACHQVLPEFSIKEIAGRLAAVSGIRWDLIQS